MFRTALVGLVAFGGLASVAAADVVFVDAKAAIFDAGRITPTLDGLLPVELAVPAGADYMYIPEVTGLVRAHPALQWGGPDGNSTTLNDTDILSFQSISGLVHPRTLPLLGVFLTEGEPEGAAPARADYYSLGTDLAAYSPVLSQSFHIGDGWADGEVGQQFVIPAGATRVFLGLADAGYFTGDPGDGGGAYDDNDGGFSADVRFHIVPAPGPVALLGLGGLLTCRRRR